MKKKSVLCSIGLWPVSLIVVSRLLLCMKCVIGLWMIWMPVVVSLASCLVLFSMMMLFDYWCSNCLRCFVVLSFVNTVMCVS